MNKGFVSLLRREFSGRVWQLWLFFLAAALLPTLVFRLSLRPRHEIASFEELYADSAAPVLLAVLFAGLVGWMIWMTLRDFSNGSSCTLLSLPGKRGQLFWSKAAAYAGAALMLLAGVIAGILLSYSLFLLWTAQLARRLAAAHTLDAGLWLGITRSPLFRLLLPATLPEVCSSLLLLLTLPVWGCYTGWRIAGRRWVRGGVLSVLTAVCWALVFRARLADPLHIQLPGLIVLLALVLLLAADSLWLLRRGDL